MIKHYIPIRIAKIKKFKKTLTSPNTDEYMEHQELSFIAGGMQKATLWKKAVSYITKHTLTIGTSNCTPWDVPQRVGNLCPHKTCTQTSTALDS